jgi:HlyD family secretion protein
MIAQTFSPAPSIRPASRGVDDPYRELRLGGAIVAAFLAVGVIWASIAPLDAAVTASGVVKVSGERQKVQTIDDGVISALDVSEGSQVKAGQLLLELSTDDARSNERSLAARVIGLQAEIARLQAQQAGAAAIAPPVEFSRYAGDDRQLADRAMTLEAGQFHARQSALAAQQAVLDQRIVQVGDQIKGTQVRHQAINQQRALLGQELQSLESLAAQGYAPKNRVLEMQRSAADLDGSAGELNSESARLAGSAGETRMQILQTRSQEMDETATRLRDAQTELHTLMPQWTAAKQQVARTQVRAPVSGTVVGLAVHTVGGVAAHGQTLMEIVPQDRDLTIEAKVPVTDANQLYSGQDARLRIAAVHGRNVPVLKGEVTRVSADSFTDERTGQSFYTMNVSVPASELARLSGVEGRAGVLRPGNPVQVMVTTRSRSALEYWLEPLTQTFAGALHQG